jgi:hypothetical protein
MNTLYILGSGPSLKTEEVRLLKYQETISFNRAYIAWHDWGFAPQRHMVIDLRVLECIHEDLLALLDLYHGTTLYLNADGKWPEAEARGDRIRWLALTHDPARGYDPAHPRYCGDVAACSVQVAGAEGFARVVLLGVDQKWRGRPSSLTDGDARIASDSNDTDHFRPNYYSAGLRYSAECADAHIQSWERTIMEAAGSIQIVSANPCSALNRWLPLIDLRQTIPVVSRIVVAGNGPSAQAEPVRAWADRSGRFFRANYFFLPPNDALRYRVDDWFVCQHDPADLRAAVAFVRGQNKSGQPNVVFWLPGTTEKCMTPEECQTRLGAEVRIQKTFAGLPVGCRWSQDLAPERPLMGSFAIAVAVGMKPDELYLCGHDLFQNRGQPHGGVNHSTRGAWQDEFIEAYLSNAHRNHTLRGDLKYIRAALQEFRGKAVICGSVLRLHFEQEFADRGWEWIDG